MKTRFTIGVIAALVAGFFTTTPALAIPPQIAITNVVSTEDGFTFLIANYDSQYTYTVSSSAGVASINLTGLVTVSNLTQGETAMAFVQSWGGGQGTANNVTGQALWAANTPAFGMATQQPGTIPNGIATRTQVSITNFNEAFTYTVSSTAGSASVDDQGLITISDHDYGVALTVTVTTTRSGYANGTATYSLEAFSRGPADTPTFGTVTKLADGFEAQITNFVNFSSYSYSATSTAGSASVVTRGGQKYLVVSGLSGGQSATATVRYVLYSLSPSTATLTSEALVSLSAPLYPSAFAQSATSAFVTWGSVDGATSYRVTASNGGGTCTNTINYCTISGLTAGQNYTFEIVALRDGVAGPAAQTAGVLMASALDVGGSLSSSTWKVGAVVTATPLIVGQHSVVRYEWYRCNAAVPVSETVPACEVIAGADGAAYTLKAADLGKYVTAHLRVTGGAGQVGATIANSRPVLAASAAGGALVDPDGKPLIAEIPTRQISVVGGTTITINGTGFTNVTSVLVNGVAATVLSATDTTLIISVPASNQVGLVDVAVVTPKGTVTEASALAYVAKQASISSKSRTLTGFAGSATKLTAKQKAEIKAFVRANASLPKLVCAATTAGVKKTTAETKATQARARAACSYASSISANVFTATKATHGKTSGKVTKLVTITISN
jgi:titin